MLVKDIMSTKVQWAAPDVSLQEAARKMRDLNIGCLPVTEQADGRIVGIVTDRDIVCRAVAEGRDCAAATVGEIMSQGTCYCFDDQDIADAARLMEEKQVHRLPVLDRNERLAGLLSLADVALHCPQDLAGEVARAVSRHAA